MASLESLLTRAIVAETMTGIVTDDKAVAVEIVHTSSVAVTHVVNISATSIELHDATETYTFLYATYMTLGTLVDAINATAVGWKARVLDGLRATLTASSVLLPDSAVTAVTRGGESVYELKLDTHAALATFYRVSMDRGVLRDDHGSLKTEKPLGGHRVKITGITYRQNMNAAALNGVRIYEYDPKLQTETQVWSAKSVDDTATTHDFTLMPIAAAEGNDLVVMVTNATSMDDAVTNSLAVNYVRE